ncbi:MAG: molybdopterin molybdotransferase MoeA [Phycisphaerales bacterium]|nr:molybdopterin molybdotransferase MoeA [Phycisphaerales bacterium]
MPPLPNYEDALEQVLRHAEVMTSTESVALDGAMDRILADGVRADRDQPPFNRAALDGYAMRHADLQQSDTFQVVATVAAGQPATVDVPPGTCVAIATGAPVPETLDMVIPHERSDRGDRNGASVRFQSTDLPAGNAIHLRGADAGKDDVLVQPGTRLAPAHLGLAAAVGLDAVTVRTRPRVHLLTSGDEIVNRTCDPLPHQVRNSNGPMLGGLIERMGAVLAAHHHVPDEPDDVRAALETALATADVVVTVGGISAGDRDFIPPMLDALGVTTLLAGAAIQPGRPIRVARDNSGTMVVSLPGNPVSVLAMACLFLWPVLHAKLGCAAPVPWREITLARDVQPNPRRSQFRPAVLDAAGDATVPHWQGSGDLAHTAETDGLVALPMQDQPVPAGTRLPFLPWP